MVIGDNRHATASLNTDTGEVTDQDEAVLLINVTRNAWGQFSYYLMPATGDGSGYSAKINKNLEIVSTINQEVNDAIQKCIDKNYDHLLEIMDYAAEMWELP